MWSSGGGRSPLASGYNIWKWGDDVEGLLDTVELNSLLSAMFRLFLIFLTLPMIACCESSHQDLFFKEEPTKEGTKYTLQSRREHEVVSIWEKKVPFIDGQKPAEWCNIITWKKDDSGILVLVNYNDIFGALLQFGPKGELVSEMGSTWLRLIRAGGEVELHPPDRVVLKSPQGAAEKLVIRGGALYTEEGSAYVD